MVKKPKPKKMVDALEEVNSNICHHLENLLLFDQKDQGLCKGICKEYVKEK